VLAQEGRGGFSELEMQLLTLYANHTAVAMENAKLYEDLRRLAVSDSLTGLFNRRHFWQALERELARAQRYTRPLSLILLDVDGFKKYNDAYGHLAGDETLRELGKLLGRLIRRTDVLARYGGDEFVLVMSDTDRAGAIEVADKIGKAVAAHRFPHGSVTVSLGVAAFPEDAPGDKSLVETADAFLYAAKQGGRNTLGQVSARVPTPSSRGTRE
jgi:diguanylate cyclase (GGDEF)-like protein